MGKYLKKAVLFRMVGMQHTFSTNTICLQDISARNIALPWRLAIHPFLIIKNKRLFISSEGFSELFLNLNLPGRVWQPAADNNGWNKVRQTVFIICRSLSHLTRWLSRIVCRGQEGPKGSKGTLRLDLQANTRPRIFEKANFTTRYRKEVVRKSRYS